jgi:hypothetical protein
MNVPSESSSGSATRIARAVVASVFVAGIAALVVLHGGWGGAPSSHPDSTLSPGSLHAPATDPSLPAADHVFASRPAADEAAAPTF